MSGGGGSNTTATDPWSAQQPYLKDLFAQSQGLAQGGVPDVTRATEASQEAVEAYQASVPAVSGIATGAAQQQAFLSEDVLRPESNPALQEYIALANQETARAFNQNVLPGLKGQAQAVGGVGGSRAGIAEGLATQGLQRQIAQQTAGITSAAYGQGLNAYTRGLALAPQTAGLQGAPGAAQQQISSLLERIETLPYEQQLQLLQDYQGLIGGSYGSQTTGPETQTGGLSGALGGASLGTGIYQALGGAGTAATATAPAVAGSAFSLPLLLGVGAVAGYFS